MGHVLLMAQNSQKLDFLKLFTLQWLLSHSYILYKLAHKVFVVKNFQAKKKLFRHSLNESLNFFSHETKSYEDFFQGLNRNP